MARNARGGHPGRDERKPILLPVDWLSAAGVPNHLRAEVAYRDATAKLCALVEVYIAKTGESPRVSVDRIKEILEYETTSGYALEQNVDRAADGDFFVYGIADPDGVLDAVERFELRRMGPSAN